MTRTEAPRPIVVGIDGSDAAIRATQWAAGEAVRREVPLRLVHIIEPGSEAVRLETEYAEISLRTACTAAKFANRQVRVGAEILRGEIDATLADESRGAELICIGSSPANGCGDRPAGSTAAALVRSAQCQVVVIDTTDRHLQPGTGNGWAQDALTEARIRMNSRDGAVDTASTGTNIIAFLTQIARSVSRTIVDGPDSDGVARFIQPAHRELRLIPNDEWAPDHEREQSSGSGARTPK
ncbi:hypothetical protein BH09ACT7_BH09ACT7_39090 [soil metagenome]